MIRSISLDYLKLRYVRNAVESVHEHVEYCESFHSFELQYLKIMGLKSLEQLEDMIPLDELWIPSWQAMQDLNENCNEVHDALSAYDKTGILEQYCLDFYVKKSQLVLGTSFDWLCSHDGCWHTKAERILTFTLDSLRDRVRFLERFCVPEDWSELDFIRE